MRVAPSPKIDQNTKATCPNAIAHCHHGTINHLDVTYEIDMFHFGTKCKWLRNCSHWLPREITRSLTHLDFTEKARSHCRSIIITYRIKGITFWWTLWFWQLRPFLTSQLRHIHRLCLFGEKLSCTNFWFWLSP